MRGGRGGDSSGCWGQAYMSWESWALHLNLHMLQPSGGCMNVHVDRWPQPITIESASPGPSGGGGGGQKERVMARDENRKIRRR